MAGCGPFWFICSLCFNMETYLAPLRCINNIASTCCFLEIQKNLDLLISFPPVCNPLWVHSICFLWCHLIHFQEGRKVSVCHPSSTRIPKSSTTWAVDASQWLQSFFFPSLCIAVMFPVSRYSLTYWLHSGSFFNQFSCSHRLIDW